MSNSSEFENEAIEAINDYRKDHGTPPLELNKEICEISQKRAEKLANDDSLDFSGNHEYGESIFCGWSSESNFEIRARDCISKWYNEINNYSFGKEPDLLTCGHFTQIIWKNTKQVGVGNAISESGKLYIVVNYHPPGNNRGQFIDNVPPPGPLQFIAPSPPFPNKKGNKKPNDSIDLVKEFGQFVVDCLNAHNFYRKKHGVPSLTLNKNICNYAEEWARNLTYMGRLQHRQPNRYGENIYFIGTCDPNYNLEGKAPVDSWYSEINQYVFGREPCDLRAGHFTQVVWEDSKELGVGVGKTGTGHIYVVANYSPPGNMIGSFARKVHPLVN